MALNVAVDLPAGDRGVLDSGQSTMTADEVGSVLPYSFDELDHQT